MSQAQSDTIYDQWITLIIGFRFKGQLNAMRGLKLDWQKTDQREFQALKTWIQVLDIELIEYAPANHHFYFQSRMLKSISSTLNVWIFRTKRPFWQLF